MKVERGSTWNRWDFHIHTPYSILNNGFGFAITEDDEDEFDEYVKQLFSRAIENDVVAIGVTDYFSIDGYKRIRQRYLSDPLKMKHLFPDPVMRNKISEIFVFPNVEFRLNVFIGKGSHPLNYHVLFSDKVSITDIEENFLQRLEIPHEGNQTLPLTHANIEKIGHEYKSHNPEECREDYLVGLERITVDHKRIKDVLAESTMLHGKHLVTVPVDEDLSQVEWNGRDYQTRKIIYQQCDLLMTSNANTRQWALAKDHEEKQILEFGSIMPCVWGSDAHDYDHLFRPAMDRFCWIKANPTFEGLQQIIYEPDDRVKIQKEKPEEKDGHQIIDSIIFLNEDFQSEPIYFSEGLTAIIGGKSTGKSILLRHIAKNVDIKQVNEREKRAASNNSKLDVDARVLWKDGVSGERKIIYIPQSWLNRIVDESSGDSQLNKMLQEILLQQEEIGDANVLLKNTVGEILESLRHDTLDYVATIEKADECEKLLREFGRSEAFNSAIKKLECQREELSTEAGLSDVALGKYSELEKQISDISEAMEVIKKEEPHIEFQQPPFVFLPQITTYGDDGMPLYDLDCIPSVKEILDEAIQKMNQAILAIWEPAIQKSQHVIDKKKKETATTLEDLKKEMQPLQDIISKNDQLRKIDSQLQEEKNKLRKAKSYEETKTEKLIKADELKKSILESRQAINEAYTTFAGKVSKTNNKDSDLVFEAEVRIRRYDLFDAINSLFDNRNLRSFKDKYKYNLLDKDDFIVDDGLFESLWEAMSRGVLSFKGGNTLQTALERLFSDWFYIHYDIKSGTDTINSMSPGKKALVLLEMIVNLEKSKCPILIDQPEDDLDNRSIYKELVTYLKTKKHERQIIVVTHNANVVIGADAEEVIIANQTGKESPNREKQFEYRQGAIENTTPVYGEDGKAIKGVLNQKGIQEQICDILEGGKVAFEKRRNKYIGMSDN